MRRILTTTACAGLILAAAPAWAQEAATLSTAESEEYGTFLTDGEGRPLYLFTADTQASDDTAAEIACKADCLDAWPPFNTEGEPKAEGDAVDASMLGTVEHDGKMVVTYNGWPLYYFVKDEGADAPQGQDIESFGGEWYLVTPEGEEVEDE